MINDHRQFLYNGGIETAKLFEKDERIPKGWFDSPNATEWKNPPVQPVKIEKYPSQMNRNELIDFGEKVGAVVNEEMTKKEMLQAINEKMKDDSDEDE